MSRRVFVTGLGIVSALGNDTRANLDSLIGLRTGIGPLTLFPSIHDKIPVAEVRLGNDALAKLSGDDKSAIPGSRNTLIALEAARQAVVSSGWHYADKKRTGGVFATTTGGMDMNERYYKSLLLTDSYKNLIGLFDSADCAEKVSMRFGIKQNITTVSTACSSSANAIMIASRMIKNGIADRVLAGGSDALTKFTINGFSALEILSPFGCKPFDKDRDGLTIGEGAAFLVLEAEDTADPGKVICEVSGYANANEAFHATASTAEGKGAAMAMIGALKSAGLDPGDIDYINAHGTGTGINDLSEGNALLKVFGNSVPPFSSTKGFTGHTLGAAGAIEAVFSALAIRDQLLIPGINFSNRMPELSISPVTEARYSVIRHVMSNSFGFGGSNTSLIFSKV